LQHRDGSLWSGPERSVFYDSIVDCLRDCADLPAAPYQYGTVSSGNSLECRLFHASSAIMGDADEHCEHTLGISLCAD